MNFVGKMVKIIDSGKIYPDYIVMAKKLGLKKWIKGWNDLYYHPETVRSSVGIVIAQNTDHKHVYCGIDLGDVEIIIGYPEVYQKIPFSVINTNIFEDDFLL